MAEYLPLTESELGEIGECLTPPMLKRVLEITLELGRLQAILMAVDYTLSVHGQIDCDTPLHERVSEAVS